MTEADRAPRPSGVAVLALAIFMVAFGTNVSTPFLVLYRDRLDLGPSATQAIFSVYVVGIIAALLVSGPLSDRIGRRAVVLPCLGLSAAASLLMIVGRDSYVVLLVARVLLGVVSGAVLSVGSAWLLELYGAGQQATAALTATIASYAGFGLGPVMSALFHRLDIAPLIAPFFAHAGLVLLALVAALGIPDPRSATPGPSSMSVNPVSSYTSRIAAASTVSLPSVPPPGVHHQLRPPQASLESSTRSAGSSSAIRPAVRKIGRSSSALTSPTRPDRVQR